jgi:hypothetical protein
MTRISIAMSLLAGMLTLAASAQESSPLSQLSGLPDISQQDLESLDLAGVVIPIPQINFGTPPQEFVGSPAIADPFPAKPVPQSAFMAPNGLSGVHLDAYQSDTYPFGGPLGRKLEVTSTFRAGLCGTVTFDSKGRIIVVCVGRRPIVYLMDPVSLQVMSRLPMPASSAGDTPSTFGAGGYFFLDQLNRAVIPTRTNDLWRVKVVEGFFGPTLVKDHTCADDLPAAIPTDQSILSTFPDSHGLLWFTTSGGNDPNAEPAMVGTVSPSASVPTACTVKLTKLPNGEIIRKSFGVDPDPSRGGVFIVSNQHLYRFDAKADGTPGETWSAPYDFGTRIKPGQLYQGSGTTPTLMGTEYVTIADNADPRMHVLVFKRTAASLANRQVCAVEVFPPGFSDSFNSLIATDTSITVENNYGYDLQRTLFGGTTVPGITRVDLDSGGTGCHTVWENKTLSVPNVVSQASLANGLEYTYTKQGDLGLTDAWYFTAVDLRTGELVYKQLAGTGVLFDSHYSSVYLGPDGKTAYVGVLGGLVRIHDKH